MFKNNGVLFIIAILWLVWAFSIKNPMIMSLVFGGFVFFMVYVWRRVKKERLQNHDYVKREGD